MSELKPCPFCGFDACLEETEIGAWSAYCPACDAKGPGIVDETRSEIIAAWNTRAADWQDISTAPRDGTKVLLYEDGSYYAGESEGADGYWTSYCGQYVVRDPEPTHWIPLPAPPKEVG